MGRRRPTPAELSNQLDLFRPEVPAGPAVLDVGEPLAPRARKGPVGPAPVTDTQRAIATTLLPVVRLGTSSWSFPGWAGIVYDRAASAEMLARDGLRSYAAHPLLRTVGVDRTYYAPLSARVFAEYAAAVPDDFRFLVKAHDVCTLPHFPASSGHRRHQPGPNAMFLDPGYAADIVVAPMVEGLGEKAGPLVFQFTPLRPAAVDGPARFADRLYQFLAGLPRGPLYAVELRTPALLTAAYAAALAAVGACHCCTVHPAMPDLDAQAEVVDVAAMPALVVRWMLGGDQRYEEARERYTPFDRLVDEDPGSRRAIADRCLAAATRRQPAFVVINNKAEGSAPLSAFQLAAVIANLGRAADDR